MLICVSNHTLSDKVILLLSVVNYLVQCIIYKCRNCIGTTNNCAKLNQETRKWIISRNNLNWCSADMIIKIQRRHCINWEGIMVISVLIRMKLLPKIIFVNSRYNIQMIVTQQWFSSSTSIVHFLVTVQFI